MYGRGQSAGARACVNIVVQCYERVQVGGVAERVRALMGRAEAAQTPVETYLSVTCSSVERLISPPSVDPFTLTDVAGI